MAENLRAQMIEELNINNQQINNDNNNPNYYRYGRFLTDEEFEKEKKRQRHVPFWMKLFIGGNSKPNSNCRHVHGFLSGMDN